MINSNFIRIKITLFCCFLISPFFNFAQTNSSLISTNIKPENQYNLFNYNPSFDPGDFNDYIRKATWLRLKKESLKRLFETQPQSFLLNLPLANGTELQLVLERHQILTDDFSVQTPKGKTSYQKGLYYKGHLLRKNNTIAAISIFEDMLMGVLSYNGENYVLGHLYQDEFPAGEHYILYKESDLQISSNFDCMSDELPTVGHPDTAPVAAPTRSSLDDVVRVYIEADYQLYQERNENTSTASNYITGFFNVGRCFI